VERSDWADDDPQGFHAPLPPDDRLWRHPSELAAGIQPASAAVARPAERHRARTVVVVVAATAALAVGVGLWLVNPGDTETAESGAASLPTTSLLATTLPIPLAASQSPVGVLKLVAHTAAGDRAATAVAIDTDGTLVTTSAAVHDAKSVDVVMPDGSRTTARVIGLDAGAGAAVLVIDKTVVAATTGHAATLELGASVATPGPASTSGKVTEMGVRTPAAGGGMLEHQLTVELPGGATVAEGEPLMDGDGNVVALCGRDGSGNVHGVPIELARSAARSIRRDGKVRATWLGVSGRNGTAADGGDGALVQDVKEGSPAAAAGVRVGDRVVTIDGMQVSSMAGLVLAVRDHDPGSLVSLDVVRDGATVVIAVSLGEKS